MKHHSAFQVHKVTKSDIKKIVVKSQMMLLRLAFLSITDGAEFT